MPNCQLSNTTAAPSHPQTYIQYVCVSMYICMDVCWYVCMHVQYSMYVFMYVRMYVCMHVQNVAYVCIYACMSM